MNINILGQVEISEKEAFEFLYSTNVATLKNVYIDNDSIVEQYNSAVKLNADKLPLLSTLNSDVDVKTFDQQNQSQWFMPPEYKKFDIRSWLIDQCQTEEQVHRVNEELALFDQNNMVDLLLYLKYLVDTLKENKIVSGLGRGSSVASYVLYLLGIHKIDPISYNIPITEFFK